MPIKVIQNDDLNLLSSLSMGSRAGYLRRLMNDLYDGGFTVTEVARKIEITYQSLSAIEKNTVANPSFKVIHNLSKVFNVSIDVFTDDYYLHNPKPFTLGFNENDTPLPDIKIEKKPTNTSPKFRFGALHYQIDEADQLIFTHDIQTNKPVDLANMIQIIARYDFEHKLLNTISELGNPQLMIERGRSYNDILLKYFKILDDPITRAISDDKERLIQNYFAANPINKE